MNPGSEFTSARTFTMAHNLQSSLHVLIKLFSVANEMVMIGRRRPKKKNDNNLVNNNNNDV